MKENGEKDSESTQESSYEHTETEAARTGPMQICTSSSIIYHIFQFRSFIGLLNLSLVGL